MNEVKVDKQFCDRVASAGLGGLDVKYNTWDLCERAILEGVSGDFVEAGTYKGSHPMIMAEVARRHGDDRKIHLYDSFEGVPRVREARDDVEAKTYGHSESGGMESSRDSYASIEHVKAAFNANGAPLTNCIFHAGWFQNVLPFEEIPEIAVLRLDVDLLESNELCMRYLYPKLKSGGYFITDDYGRDNTGTADTWRAEFIRLLEDMGFEQPKQITQVENESGTAWWKKP